MRGRVVRVTHLFLPLFMRLYIGFTKGEYVFPSSKFNSCRISQVCKLYTMTVLFMTVFVESGTVPNNSTPKYLFN